MADRRPLRLSATQGTGINAEAKLLLLTYAFETLGVARVDPKTDARDERYGGRSPRSAPSLKARCATGRPRGPGEEGKLRDSAVFSRAAITATRFSNEHHWGSFRGDPEKMMAGYFDAFLYLANWGTRHLMFRVPGPRSAPKAPVFPPDARSRHAFGTPGPIL